MKRVIKFRGKRLDNGEWVYGHYADYIHRDCGIPSPSIIYPLPDCGNMIIAIDPSTLGQFTGLHDRIGKEIYEGDIIEYCSRVDSFGAVWQTVRVEFRVNEGGYVCVNQYRKTRDAREIVRNIVHCFNKCIVVGNIHEKKGGEQ